jgi:hypothetical protein
MNKTFWQQAKPHALAIGIFLIVSILYNLPAFQGNVLNQSDTLGWRGVAQQSFEFKEKHGHFPLWSNSLFSGMPAYQVAMEAKYNVTVALLHNVFTLWMPTPANYFFLACLGMYVLCMAMRLRTWPSIFGALGYAFASYNAVIAAVGHNTKFAAMGYAPAVLAGLILLSHRKYILGFITTLIATTLLIWQNHLQITYYTMLVSGIWGIAFLVKSIREKSYKPLLMSVGLGIVAAALSAASFAVMLIPTNSFAKETMRGGRSELTNTASGEKAAPNKTQGGLDKDYAFHWSYGVSETFTFIMPSYKGGSSGPRELPEDGKTIEALQSSNIPQDAANYFFSALSSYFGTQPGTSGPVYFGALICVFFIAGLFLIRSWHMGWIIGATILGIIMAWGSNFASVNYFLFDYLPFYNKFRAPTTSLVIPQLTFALLAAMALNSIFYGEWDSKLLMKKLKTAAIVVGILLVILTGTWLTGDFKGASDQQLRQGIAGSLTQMLAQGQQPSDQVSQQASTVAGSIMNGLAEDRKSNYGGDLLRLFLYVLIGTSLTWFAIKRKMNATNLLIGLTVVSFIDLAIVDWRYLNKGNYIPEEEFLAPFAANTADLQIKQDTGFYRVFDQTGDNPFTDSRASYHHNSIGGYLPARLSHYDDVITHQLNKGNMAVFNMLNTKYFIMRDQRSGQAVAQLNPEASGPVWLVKTLKYVNNADEEMQALNNFNFRDTAVLDKREQTKVGFAPQYDSLATIKLLKNENDRITYTFNAASNQFAVFSEVYYNNGWKAFVNGKETPIVRVDYTLRGLPLPAGKYDIEFRFEPESYRTGNTITLVTGIISILLLLACCYLLWQEEKKKQTTVKG